MASAFGFYDAHPRPCHPERSNYFAASCEMLRSRTRPKGGRRKAGSPTQVSTIFILRDPAPSGHHPKGWFDCAKHHPWYLAPLRMTRNCSLHL